MKQFLLYIFPLTVAAVLWSCADADLNEPIGTLRPVGAEIGKEAPTFSLQQPDGKLLNLADLKGKVVYVDFWASWCAPCLALLPSLKDIWQDYKDQDFVILGVSRDYTKDAWSSFLNEEGIDWLNVYEAAPNKPAPVSVLYGVVGIPRSYLIDKEGVVVAVDLVGENLRDSLDFYLAQ